MDSTVEQPAAEREPDHITPADETLDDQLRQLDEERARLRELDAPAEPERRTVAGYPRFAPDAELVVDMHNGDEVWTGAEWNAYVESAERNQNMVTARLIECPPPVDTDLAPTPDVRHFANLADAHTVCGLERSTVRWTDDPATPVDCPACTAPLADEQLVEDDEDDDLVPAPGCGHPMPPGVDCCVSTHATPEPTPEPERRTVSLEVLTDELREHAVHLAVTDHARAELLAARVALVLRVNGHPVAVPDTEVPWTIGTPGEPVKALRGLLSEMISGANRLEREGGGKVDLLMPAPDVLAALDGRPDAQLLTAPVWVLAMDVTPGMLLAPEVDLEQQLVTARPSCTRPDCVYGSCAVIVVDGSEQHQSGYARIRVCIPAAVTA